MSDQGNAGAERGRRGRLRSRGAPPTPEPPNGAGRDPLTGLAGRGVLHDWLQQAAAASRPNSTRVILAFVDLDSLRDVNDSFGPDAGDFVLRQAAERLTNLGWQETRILRWGGAEFAVVVPHVGSVDAPDQIARALLETVGAPYPLGSQQVTVACHLGLAIASDAYNDLGELIRDGHQALVSARDGGPGIYVIHDETKRGRYTTRIDEARLYAALENHEFLLHWQPIVRAASRELIGAEALLRWQAPGATNTGVMFPHDFLPLLEKSGLIVPVGEWVIAETCRQAVDWTIAHPGATPLFVTCNLGARQLAMPGFDEGVLRILAQSGLPPDRLCLDITEEAIRYNGSSTWTALRRLKDAGVKLGLGNFGTGVASLAAMRDMRLDLVRIDRLFVQELAMSYEDQAIIRHITNLAHDLGMITIVEGIETEEQAALLFALGVDLAQGFLFGRPEPPDQIDARLDPVDPGAVFGEGETDFPPPQVGGPFPEPAPSAAPPDLSPPAYTGLPGLAASARAPARPATPTRRSEPAVGLIIFAVRVCWARPGGRPGPA